MPINRTLWVVEMRVPSNKYRWEPTVGVGVCREHGRRELKEWKTRNSSDFFRLRPYRRVL